MEPGQPLDSAGTPFVVQRLESILLQAVITKLEKHDSGSVIELLEPAWEQIAGLLIKDPSLAFKLRPEKWEEIIAASYDKAGYDEVILTPRSGDLGRDVIASKGGRGSIRIIAQVKAYKPGHNVTANDVRALLGVLQADHSATKGVVTTTSDFAPGIKTDPFIQPFVPYRLELINGDALVNHLRSLKETE